MTNPLSTPLDAYLARKPAAGKFRPSHYVEAGAACVSDEDLVRLRRLLPQVRKKAERSDSMHLRRRVELLVQRFLHPARPGEETQARREAAFALFYLLKGYDLVPDSVPEVGYLDDLQVVDAVVRRHPAAMRMLAVPARRRPVTRRSR